MSCQDYASHEALAQAQARLSEDMPLLPVHLLALTQSMARTFYSMQNCDVPMSHDFRNAVHPQEQLVWQQACHATALLRQCTIEDVFDEYDDERGGALK